MNDKVKLVVDYFLDKKLLATYVGQVADGGVGRMLIAAEEGSDPVQNRQELGFSPFRFEG